MIFLSDPKTYEMKFPETDPPAYRGWVKEGWQDMILEELEKLLLFVRDNIISGLQVGKIRAACFVPFAMKDLYNRKVWLYMNEIEAYNNRYEKPVDEEDLELEWKLSGLKRPTRTEEFLDA